MVSQLEVGMRDFDGTKKTTSIAVGDATSDTARGTLNTEIRKWTLGSVGGSFNKKEIQSDLGGSAASPAAQQTTTLILEMADSVNGLIYKEKVPIANVTKADDGSSNPAWTKQGQGTGSLTVINTAHADWALLKTAIEAVWESPNGNTGTLERGYIEN